MSHHSVQHPPSPHGGNNAPEITLTSAVDDDKLGTTSGVIIVKQDSRPDIQITGRETDQDLVDRFNDYYRRHKRHVEAVGDSLSSTAVTHSGLLRSRECRRVMMRRILIFISLFLWGITLLEAALWFELIYRWPRQFAVNDYAKEFYNVNIDDPGIYYPMLAVIVLQTYVLGSWGFLSATSAQDRVLKRFMLTAPWFLPVSMACGFAAITFVGDLSQQKLQKTMLYHQGFYHHAENLPDNFSRNGWDTVQLYLRCCGVDSPDEWIKINPDLEEKMPWSCCRNSHGRRQTNQTLVAHCTRDTDLNHVFTAGCKERVFEFLTYAGAGVTALFFVVTLLIIFATMVAHKFYVLKKKARLGHYRYPLKEYLIDFFYLRRCFTCIRRRRKAKRAAARKKSAATGVAISPGGGAIAGSASTLDEDDYAAMEEKVRAEEEAAEILQAKEDQQLAELEKKRVSMMASRPSQRFSIREPGQEGGPRMSISQPPRHQDKKTDKKDDVNLLYKNPNTGGAGGGIDVATTAAATAPRAQKNEVKRSVQIQEGITLPDPKIPIPPPPAKK